MSNSEFVKLIGTAFYKFPKAFVSFVSSKKTGTWLGATPEVLVLKDANNVFSTMALAGTQAANGKEEKEAVWKQKEIEEQAFVSSISFIV